MTRSPRAVALRSHPVTTFAVALFTVLALALALVVAQPLRGDAHGRSSAKPTIVLVHGAFADASSWYASSPG